MAAVMRHCLRRYMSTATRVQGPSAVSGGHEGGFKMWKNVSLFVAFPAIALCALNCYLEHQKHGHGRPEFVKYDYLRIRSKRFPWGDGTRSLFHNPHTNPLPNGYEE